MRGIFFLLITILIGSCAENKKAARDLRVYFDLDSLLDQQVIKLSEGGFVVEKTVTMDGESETQTGVFDSAGWAGAFAIVRDFDLNKPYNVGAYTETRSGGTLNYELTDKTLDAPVQYFTLVDSDSLLEISSEYFEDKSIYQHRRKLHLKFKDDLLVKYEIRGFQKMVMKDTIYYRIAGEVKVRE